jgi:chemotaxis protein MotB
MTRVLVAVPALLLIAVAMVFGGQPAEPESKPSNQSRTTSEAGIINSGEPRAEPRDGEDSQFRLNALALERDILQSKVTDLQRQLEMVQQDLASGKKALSDASARISALEKEKGQLTAAVSEARDQARDLTTKLAAEQVKSATLREDKQRLMSGTTTAKEEIARLQKRAGELETQAARAEDLAKRLAERDQEIDRLRKIAADHESLTAKVGGLTKELDRAKQRVSALTEELAARSEEAARIRQEREQLALEIRRQQESPRAEEASSAPAEQTQVKSLERIVSPDSADKTARDTAKLDGSSIQETRRSADEPIKPSANGTKQTGKEPAVQHLIAAQASLAKSFDAEITKGDLSLLQARDRLTISVVDRALFDPGQAQVKPEGLKLLKKVSDALKGVPDKQVRVEGHPDDPSSAKQRERTGTWDLPVARATNVAQHLLDEGVVESAALSFGISGETKSAGQSEDGRLSHRRMEIIVSPKN